MPNVTWSSRIKKTTSRVCPKCHTYPKHDAILCCKQKKNIISRIHYRRCFVFALWWQRWWTGIGDLQDFFGNSVEGNRMHVTGVVTGGESSVSHPLDVVACDGVKTTAPLCIGDTAAKPKRKAGVAQRLMMNPHAQTVPHYDDKAWRPYHFYSHSIDFYSMRFLFRKQSFSLGISPKLM